MVPKLTVGLQLSPSADLLQEGMSENMRGEKESHMKVPRRLQRMTQWR